MNAFEVQFSENNKEFETDFTDGTRVLNGKSAYELAVQHGFDGSEDEWLDSLIGKDGEPGIDGKHAYVFTTSGSSSSYTASIEDYTEYAKGDLFVMIPHITATSTSPKLNINNLGYYSIQRRSYNSTMRGLRATGCIAKGLPELLVFTGSCFLALTQYQPYGGTDFYTSVSVSKGGTGRTSWSANRLIYASGTSTLSQLYPPSEPSVLMQKSSSAPYWITQQAFTSGLMVFKGIHTDTNKMPPLSKGHTYKFVNDVTVVAPGDITEVSYCMDGSTSFYCYEYGIEMYSYENDNCFTELTKILPTEYVNQNNNEPFTLIVIPKSNEANATPYVFNCTAAYSYKNEYEDGYVDYWSNFSGNWQDNIFPTEGLSSGQYITMRIPTGTYPAGTYVCTGVDWETLI